MKNLLIATAVAAALSLPLGADAASSDELAQIREQLQSLMQRVDKLEQENTTLKAQNESLKAQDDYLKAETRGLRKEAATAASEIGKVKGSDWAGKVAVKGDLRYRHEQISDETSTAGVQNVADRYRDRIRARVNVEAKATDNLLVGIGFTTTENGDPRSSNQSLDGTFTRKSVDLDLAYFDWKFASFGNLVGGKIKHPVVKPGGSGLFWDNDINPEGLALVFNRGIWFGSAYNYWIDEVSGSESGARTSDAHMVGGQIGARIPLGASTLVVAGHYYDLGAAQGRRGIFYNCSNATATSCANGNTLTSTTVTAANPIALGLAHDFQVAELWAEFNTNFGTWPFQAWVDVAENQDPDDLNMAWNAGFLFGKAANYRTWEFGAVYQVLEKDALFAQLIDSDFAGGVSDSEGWVLRAGYAPVRNWTLNATYFMNKLNVDVPASVGGPREIDYDRLQLDFNVKF